MQSVLLRPGLQESSFCLLGERRSGWVGQRVRTSRWDAYEFGPPSIKRTGGLVCWEGERGVRVVRDSFVKSRHGHSIETGNHKPRAVFVGSLRAERGFTQIYTYVSDKASISSDIQSPRIPCPAPTLCEASLVPEPNTSFCEPLTPNPELIPSHPSRMHPGNSRHYTLPSP